MSLRAPLTKAQDFKRKMQNREAAVLGSLRVAESLIQLRGDAGTALGIETRIASLRDEVGMGRRCPVTLRVDSFLRQGRHKGNRASPGDIASRAEWVVFDTSRSTTILVG